MSYTNECTQSIIEHRDEINRLFQMGYVMRQIAQDIGLTCQVNLFNNVNIYNSDRPRVILPNDIQPDNMLTALARIIVRHYREDNADRNNPGREYNLEDSESTGENDSHTESDSDSESDSNADSDTDSNADSDSETESDSNADSDSETESDSNADSDSETESDSNADSDSESESDSNADSDSESESEFNADTRYRK